MSQSSRVEEALNIIRDLYDIVDRLDDRSQDFIRDMAAKADEYEDDLYVSDAQWDWIVNLEEKYL